MVVINIYDIRAAGEGFHLIILPATPSDVIKGSVTKKVNEFVY
jgi:hypothetical protein